MEIALGSDLETNPKSGTLAIELTLGSSTRSKNSQESINYVIVSIKDQHRLTNSTYGGRQDLKVRVNKLYEC